MSLEQKLVDALTSKDKFQKSEVFKEIYDTYYNLVCFCIYQYVKNNQDVEELANDVFINFFNSLDNTTIHNIKYYLTATSRNLSLNFNRNNKKNNTIIIDTCLVLQQKEVSNHDSNLTNELKEILSCKEYYLVMEHIVNGRKLRDIASELNTPYQNIKKRYYRIIQKVKKELKHYAKKKNN